MNYLQEINRLTDKLNDRSKEIKALNLDLALCNSAVDEKARLLGQCESALSKRDVKIKSLEAKATVLSERVDRMESISKARGSKLVVLESDNALLEAKLDKQKKIIGEVEGYLSAAEVGSMSSNNSKNLAGELLQMIESTNQ